GSIASRRRGMGAGEDRSRSEGRRHRVAGRYDAACGMGARAYAGVHGLDDNGPGWGKELFDCDLRMRWTERRCEARWPSALSDTRGRHARDVHQAEETQA